MAIKSSKKDNTRGWRCRYRLGFKPGLLFVRHYAKRPDVMDAPACTALMPH